MTDPRDAITFPYRVPHIFISWCARSRDLATKTFSISAFDIPMAFMGYTALSVLRHTTRETPQVAAASITFSVPRTFVLTASTGKNSHDGTCLSAAALKT